MIFGDDTEAKQTVRAIIDEFGFDAVDGGPLAESWRQEPDTPAYGQPYGRWDGPMMVAGTDEIAAALAKAER